ncbi:hypothetical protein ACFQ7G_39385 [Streptomyces massasporeus]
MGESHARERGFPEGGEASGAVDAGRFEIPDRTHDPVGAGVDR